MIFSKVGFACALVLAYCCSIAAPTAGQTAGAAAPVTPEGWRADIAYVVERIEAMHPMPFRRISRAQFENEAKSLEDRASGLSRDETVAGIARLVALIGDGHTAIPTEALRQFGDHVLPLRLYRYGDGLYVQAADQRYAAALGARLVSVEGVPAADVERLVRPLIPHDNDATILGRLPSYLVIPEVLHGVGVLRKTGTPVRLTFEKGGRTIPLAVEPVVLPPQVDVHDDALAYTASWVDARQDGGSNPAAHINADRSYWFEYRPATQTVFVQYNRPVSDPGESMPAFAKRLRAEIAARAPQRVVLDLRQNEGGEAFWNKFLFLALLKSNDVDVKGKLFVLIGRQTFSAGSLLAIELDKYSNAVFIGEPTGGGIQNFGEHEPVELPNSHLRLLVATRFYQNTTFGADRPWIAPEIAVERTASDYEAGRDPALAAAVSYVPPKTVLERALTAVPAGEARAAFGAFAANPAYRYLNRDDVLIQVGYDLIRAKDYERAIAAMLLATAENPKSANAFDSLGDAYRAAGRRDEAIAGYRRALAIAPDWMSSRQSLSEMGIQAPPPAH
jgi:hypothetical protein